ncbi:MAG TPA: bifunctional GNAT family N-acetyltransferase/GrpB family protein [Acidimicrobiales bacterium]|nr:bifunctional GNAT family N-acetyltransferase/GrpB family protein [Acidimicrobiales bacterium]
MTATVRPAQSPEEWAAAAELLFAYHQETAVEVGQNRPERPEEVWKPVRPEVADPSSVLTTYLVAYEDRRPVGGVAVVAHDAASLRLKRCYVRPDRRRRGVGRSLVEAAAGVAAQRGVGRLVLDILPTRRGAITAWRCLAFAECEPWGGPDMVYLERPVLPSSSDWVGLRDDVVSLAESDPRWGGVYQHQAEVVRHRLGEVAAGVEHVGSTAVPSLVAKPVVDLAVRLRAGADEVAAIASLEAAGYGFRGDMGQEGGLLFVLDDRSGRRIAQLHVLRHGDQQWYEYVRFRDRLRADDDARVAYATLKRSLASRFPANREAYTHAKAPFIEEVLRPERGSASSALFRGGGGGPAAQELPSDEGETHQGHDEGHRRKRQSPVPQIPALPGFTGAEDEDHQADSCDPEEEKPA